MLLFATMCHTSALNSWHAFNVLLTSHQLNIESLNDVDEKSFRELSVKFDTF